MTDRVMIFIPAYNCEKQLPRVLEKINSEVQKFVQEVVIIDNCSADGTIEAAKAAAQELTTRVTIFRNNENYNLGGSIKRAFLYAIENEYDHMITLHGDDQADIRDMLPLMKIDGLNDWDLIIGARFHPESTLIGYSLVRIVGNRVLNIACTAVTGKRVYDLIAGINCFNIKFFKSKFFMRFPDNLTFDSHVLLYAFDKKARIKYLRIIWRDEDQISNAKVIRQGLTILRLFFDYVLKGAAVFQFDKSGRPRGFMYESEVVFQKAASL